MRALRTPLTLAILALVVERPCHPYEMKTLLRERHTDEVVRVKGGSVYDAVGRLEKAGLVEAVETTREGARPERTVYRPTKAGREIMRELLEEYIGTPAEEYPVFIAGLAHILGLESESASALLAARAEAMQKTYDEVDRHLAASAKELPRVVLLEVEYAQAVRKAELTWLRKVVRDIDNGNLEWITPDA